MPKIKKQTTIEDLAQMTARGFQEMDEKFSKRFDRIDNDIAGFKDEIKNVWSKLESLDRRVAYIEDKITEHSKILAGLSEELRGIKSLLQKYQEDNEIDEGKVIALEKRVEKLEVKIFR